MTGSLQQKHGYYYAVLNIYDDDKKRTQKWVPTDIPVAGNHKRQAEIRLREIIDEYGSKCISSQSDTDFCVWLEKWYSAKTDTVEEMTMQGYRSYLDTHILPYFRKHPIKLQDIETKDVQKYIDFKKKEKNPRCNNGVMSPRSIRLHWIVIDEALKLAVKQKIIASNPAADVVLPRQIKYNADHFTVPELKKMLELLQKDPLFDVLLFEFYYGFRRSEVVALKWDAVDMDAGIITVKRTITRLKGAPIEKEREKNKSSNRSVPIAPEIKQLFTDIKNEQAKNGCCNKGYVFCRPDGNPFDVSYVSKHFSKALEKAGLRHIRFHDLRHSCASMMLNSGCNLRDVGAWLGHADISTTCDIYGHMETERKKTILGNISSNTSSNTF